MIYIAEGTSNRKVSARVTACNYVKFEIRQNLPPVLKIVTRPAHAARLSIVAKHARDQVFYFEYSSIILLGL